MRTLVGDLRGPSKHGVLAAEVNDFFTKRRILEASVVSGLSSDGYIEPLGRSFADGFRMVLRGGSARTRNRFTIAHELCHTFFYELVPELKYGSKGPDPEEERLCNLGAGELLMPAKPLKRHARKCAVSIDSLEELAEIYVVSPEAMLLRLRSLKLWNCELSYWRPRSSGFSLDRIVGGRKVSWVWRDDSALRQAWHSHREVVGRTYVELQSPNANPQLRFVCFQIVKRGDALMVLWAGAPFERKRQQLPLFERTASS